jgi:hypothetical protein
VSGSMKVVAPRGLRVPHAQVPDLWLLVCVGANRQLGIELFVTLLLGEGSLGRHARCPN